MFGGARPRFNAGFEAMKAKGRLKAGEMNKSEAKFDLVLRAQLQAGEIAWYAFECIKLRLADGTFLEVDFFVMQPSGELWAIDVKGGWVSDDGILKLRWAAKDFPFRFFTAKQKLVRDGGGWDIKEV